MTIVKNVSNPRISTRDVERLTGREIALEIEITDAAGDDYDIAVDDSIEIVDVSVIKNGAGAGNTLTVKNGANAISDAIAAAVDKVLSRAGSIDRANSTITAGGTLRLTTTRAAGSAAMRVIVYAISKPAGLINLVTAP